MAFWADSTFCHFKNNMMVSMFYFPIFIIHSFLYFQFSAGVTPSDIKIIETDASGAVRETAGLTFGENEIIPGEFQEDLDDERGGWDNKLDFLFSCISVSVGLGSKFF